MDYDFSGWATRHDLLCTDGRTIRRNAFKENDGARVPLIWMHDHTNPDSVLGHADLENRDEGVYAYCKFNDTENGKLAKQLVEHGDVKSLSIWANQLKQIGKDVIHGKIRELSLVLAGANSGAFIDAVMAHSDDGEENGLIIGYDEGVMVLSHSDEDGEEEVSEEKIDAEVEDDADEAESDSEDNGEEPAEEDVEMKHSDEPVKQESGKTLKEIYDSLNEDQKTLLHAMVGAVAEGDGADKEDEVKHSDEENEGGKDIMKQNVFDQKEIKQTHVISHADQESIMELAKQSSVGSFKQAMQIYAEQNNLAHGDGVGVFEDPTVLFPDFELLKKGAPETIWPMDNDWVEPALRKIHKSPFARIKTRFADARIAELKAKGYQNKGDEKTVMGQIKMIGRETTPQTIYIKSSLHRDDIIDITDFDYVAYQWAVMNRTMKETLIMAAMVGDGLEDVDPDKIHEDHIRPIWKDDEEYTIHYDVDIEAARTELQGTNTSANFSENYIYAEAIIKAALYSREKFKGTGTPDFYCTPHLVNVMLLARDLNGRRIYDSKADLARALNCNSIIEVEHFEGLTRTDAEGKTKKLLGLFVSLNDYTFGSTKGGELTKFEDFDIDFNLKKFLLETRLSGSLYKLKSAIALEEPVTDGAEG